MRSNIGSSGFTNSRMDAILLTTLRITVTATAIIVLFSLPSSGDESAKEREARSRSLQIRTEQLKDSWPKILATWTPVAVGRFDRATFDSVGKDIRKLDRIKLNETAQRALRELLEQEATPADGYHAGCFYPSHFLIFQTDVDDENEAEEFQMLIDFHSGGEATTLGAVPDGEWKLALKSFSDEVTGYLNGVLDASSAVRAGDE
ncbi:MAG: hypothetical protein R3F19_17625 [Verrucomicrobiales bacterium]